MARILVVEDDPDIAALLQDGLELDGHVICVCLRGTDAVAAAGQFRPDVVLLDLMLPDLDGWQVAGQMREHAHFAAVPIVVLSGLHSVAERAAEIGTPHYLAKPFNIPDLSQLVQRVTNS